MGAVARTLVSLELSSPLGGKPSTCGADVRSNTHNLLQRAIETTPEPAPTYFDVRMPT